MRYNEWQSGDSVSREDYRKLMIELEDKRVKERSKHQELLTSFISKPLPPLMPLSPCGMYSDGSFCISSIIAEQLNLYKIPKPVKPKNRWWSWIKFF